MDKKDSVDIDWAAIIDLLASEYGWTIRYIKSLDLGQVLSLKEAIRKRYEYQNTGISDNAGSVSSRDELSMLHFEKMGKKHIREDGTVEIII